MIGVRYSKFLVETEDEMEEWINNLNGLEDLVIFKQLWQVQEGIDLQSEEDECSSKCYCNSSIVIQYQGVLSNFRSCMYKILRGCFISLLPRSIKALDFQEKYQNFFIIKGYPPRW